MSTLARHFRLLYLPGVVKVDMGIAQTAAVGREPASVISSRAIQRFNATTTGNGPLRWSKTRKRRIAAMQ